MRTPLYDWHIAQGARMVDFASWEMPIQYGSIVDEHQAVRTAAGMFDISHMGRLLFEGTDALSLIQEVYTNDAATMSVGQARYGLICNNEGGVLDDVLVYRFDQFWMMVVNASNREKIVNWLEQHRGRRQVATRDATAALSMVAVQGPRATDIICDVFARQPWNRDAKAQLIARLKYYHALPPIECDADDNPVIVSRTGYTGEDGFEVSLPAGQVTAFAEGVFESAKKLGVLMMPCGLGARDTLRLEAAMALYGHELTEAIDPFQAGVGWAVKMDKGPFIGREALVARWKNKALPHRVGVELEGKRIAREGAAIQVAGKEIGRVTSGTFSPTLAKSIAMGYVEAGYTAPGTECEVDVRGKAAAARIVSLPFYRRKK
jgi:aminomethyltransferase